MIGLMAECCRTGKTTSGHVANYGTENSVSRWSMVSRCDLLRGTQLLIDYVIGSYIIDRNGHEVLTTTHYRHLHRLPLQG
jgi:hypothetical protein